MIVAVVGSSQTHSAPAQAYVRYPDRPATPTIPAFCTLAHCNCCQVHCRCGCIIIELTVNDTGLSIATDGDVSLVNFAIRLL